MKTNNVVMTPQQFKDLLDKQDEKPEEWAALADNLPDGLKERARAVWEALAEFREYFVPAEYRQSLEYWYGGFAVSAMPERDIESWEWMAREFLARIEKFPAFSRKNIWRGVVKESRELFPLPVVSVGRKG
jgi:hypothetical protein